MACTRARDNEGGLLADMWALGRAIVVAVEPSRAAEGFLVSVRSVSVFPTMNPDTDVLRWVPHEDVSFPARKGPVTMMNVYGIVSNSVRFPRETLVGDKDQSVACLEAVRGVHVITWGGGMREADSGVGTAAAVPPDGP